MIDSFTGVFSFLSNFYPAPPPSLEHHYQAAKATSDAGRAFVLSAATAGEAKRRGRRIVNIRQDWEEVKVQVMMDLLRTKFVLGSNLAKALVLTGSAELVEGNRWHDNFWGNCSCVRCGGTPGQNHLGKLLMQVRSELRG